MLYPDEPKVEITPRFADLTRQWSEESHRAKYSYHFTWLGRPIIQYPQDIVAIQELIWRIRPGLVVETGIAHGGGLVLYASLLELLGGNRLAVGVDIEIRAHNRAAIEAHPLAHRIRLIAGSSTDAGVLSQVRALAERRGPVLVFLDSNHSHAHVLEELRLYSPLITQGSYIVAFDTVVEDLPKSLATNRPWGPGDNPKTAVFAFLNESDRFQIDRELEERLAITAAPSGYLVCVKS